MHIYSEQKNRFSAILVPLAACSPATLSAAYVPAYNSVKWQFAYHRAPLLFTLVGKLLDVWLSRVPWGKAAD